LQVERTKKRKFSFIKNLNKEERSAIGDEYYKYMKTLEKDILFFDWFEYVYLKSLKMIKLGEKLWKTTKGEITSVTPPLEGIKFPNIENKEVVASPFKMISEKREINIKDIQNIHSQLNYINQLLHQMIINEPESKPKLAKQEQNKRLGKSLIKPFKFSKEELKKLKIGRDTNSA